MFLATTASILRVIAIPTILGCTLVLIWAIRQIWNNHPSNRIKDYSCRYQDIAKMNSDEQYTFFKVEAHHEHAVVVRTVTEFNEFDFDKAMLQLIRDETEIFDVAIYATMQNTRTLKAYHEALQLCSPEITREEAENIGLSYHQAKRYEYQQINRILPYPVIDTDFTYTITYHSPSRKNDLVARKTYTRDEIMQLRKKDPCAGPVETFINVPRRRNDKPFMAEVDFRYNAEDDFQDW